MVFPFFPHKALNWGYLPRGPVSVWRRQGVRRRGQSNKPTSAGAPSLAESSKRETLYMPGEPSPWRDPARVLVMARRDPGEAWNSGQHNGDQSAVRAETGDCSGEKMALECTTFIVFKRYVCMIWTMQWSTYLVYYSYLVMYSLIYIYLIHNWL